MQTYGYIHRKKSNTLSPIPVLPAALSKIKGYENQSRMPCQTYPAFNGEQSENECQFKRDSGLVQGK